jgi:hypothetical protein
VTERVVREVLQEIPFPGPAGAIETEGDVAAGGSSGVHWGQVVSSSRTDDNILLPDNAGNFPQAAMPRATAQRWGFHHTINPASFHDTNGQGLPILTALSELVATTRNGVAAPGSANAPWVGDPWLLFRARQTILRDNGDPFLFTSAGEQLYEWGANIRLSPLHGDQLYVITNDQVVNKLSFSGKNHLFRQQPVRFPPMDYATWKQVAQSGQKGMHYLVWQDGDDYKEDGIGETRAWTTWIDSNPNAANPIGESGVYFFDTQDQTPPGEDGDGDTVADNLTPQHDWVNVTYAEGFFYVNSEEVRTTAGTSDVTVRANQPGEPFLDDGIDLHASGQTTGDDCICIRYDEGDGCVLGIRPIGYINTGTGENCSFTALPSGYRVDSCLCPLAVLAAMSPAVAQREADTFRNGVWDVDFDNDGTTDGSKDFASVAGFDTFIDDNASGNGAGHGFDPKRLPHYPSDRLTDQGRVAGDWKRDPRYQNDTVDYPTRQPHEAFLNLDYKTAGSTVANWGNASNPPPENIGVKVNYRAEDDLIEPGVFTTRARDNTGAAMDLDDIGINGVLYNEGQMEMVGALRVYGSLAVKGGFSGSGSIDIWFNEDLVKGFFPPPEWKLPRVFGSARETN